MSLQYKFFTLPIPGDLDMEEELNAFLRGVRVASVRREIVRQEERNYWAIIVEYTIGGAKDERRVSEPGKRKVDYKEELSPEDFTVFAKLRDWRKETAAREAVQLYNVFMNEQLAAMVEKRITSRTALMALDGVGHAKVEKYGDAVLAILHEAFPGAAGSPENGDATG
jgi:superfamily II DNA helicase RecQ